MIKKIFNKSTRFCISCLFASHLPILTIRKLCILKGIYPREPKNKKKVGKGSTAHRTFYYKKDIQFLLHEPLLEKFREIKIFEKKVKKALGKREMAVVDSLYQQKPDYTIDHLIKER
jgi:pescadillo protein